MAAATAFAAASLAIAAAGTAYSISAQQWAASKSAEIARNNAVRTYEEMGRQQGEANKAAALQKADHPQGGTRVGDSEGVGRGRG